MGNTASVDDDFDKFEGIDTLGYRVLGVQPDSPASEAGLVSFFDFLVGANGRILLASGEGLEDGQEYDDVDFPALCQEFLNKPLELLVWNIKCQEKRLVTITPSNTWGGAGLLGVTIRLDDYGGADERLIRVLEVETNSPAAIAGLVEGHDYLLGTTADSFETTQTLSHVLQQHVDRVVEIYVYNTESDMVRVVALMPTWSWGGNGLLGAEVGTGYLHRLPKSSLATTGSSVERKVRWVGMKPKHPTEQLHSKQEATLEVEPQLEMEVVDSEAPPDDTHKTIQQVAHHTSGNAPSIVPTANRSSGYVPPIRAIANQMTSTYVPPVEASAQTETPSREGENERRQVLPESAVAAVMPTTEPTSESNKAAAVARQSSGPAPDEMGTPATQPEAVPPAQPTQEDTTTSALGAPDAASFFSSPPPAATFTATASYASQFLPPPPMSHLARESNREVDLR